MRRFLTELRQRHVFRVGAIYLVVGWLAMQIGDVMFPALDLPAWTLTLLAALLIIGFPVALMMAWALEVTPAGIRVDRGRPAGDEHSPGASAQASPENGQSIAVLPFLDLSPGKDNEYFVDGLTEELLNSLAHVSGLRVSSRTSSFALKGKDVGIPSVAEKLGVAHVLEGSVRKSGDLVRITVQLIQAHSDSHIWSETYDRQLDDIFAIQQDIAAKIVEALSLTFRPQELSQPTTRDPKAYDYYLRGRGYLVSGGSDTTEYAARMFRQAVERDPEFVRAWSDLGRACANMALYYGGGPKAVSEAESATRRAVELEPQRAETHAARGLALMAADRFEDASVAFERALELDPALADAYHDYARALFHQGRKLKAAEMFEKAAEVDPEDYESPALASQIRIERGETELGLADARLAVKNVKRHLRDVPDNPRAFYLGAGTLFYLGETEQARRWAEHALRLAPDDGATRYNVACFYALVGDKDKAFECLENSISSRSWVEQDPELDSLRDDPRFKAFLDRLD